MFWGLSRGKRPILSLSRGSRAHFGAYPEVAEAHLGPKWGLENPFGGCRSILDLFGAYLDDLEAHLGPN